MPKEPGNQQKAGRPPKPEADRRGDTLRIRLTDTEREKLDAAADKALQGYKGPGAGVTATWARGILLKAADSALRQRNP
jgi:hypothetical protein